MRTIVLLVFLMVVRIVRGSSCVEVATEAFNKWKVNFNKSYECDYDEDRALYNFKRNKERIDEHNLNYNHNCSIAYKLGLWSRSDLSEFEIHEMYNGLDPSPIEPQVEEKSIFLGGIEIVTPTVLNFDWRDSDVVSDILDQENCACCYALAAIEAMESQLARKLILPGIGSLSAQQVLDCSFSYGNNGCDGGNTWNSFEYIQDNGLTSNSSYPFEARETGSCRYNESMKEASMLKFRYIKIISEVFLKNLLFSIGPLTVGMDASLFTFLNYKSGVYNDPECSTDLNHAMLLVGYGTDSVTGLDYWLLKNSYGESWGENGYVRMSRDIPNFCGLWDYVIFPILGL